MGGVLLSLLLVGCGGGGSSFIEDESLSDEESSPTVDPSTPDGTTTQRIGTLRLSAVNDRDSFVSDGIDTLRLEAILLDSDEAPIANQSIRFNTTLGTLSAATLATPELGTSATVTTNSDGLAEVLLYTLDAAGEVVAPGIANVSATIAGVTDTIPITLTAGPATTLTFSASSSSSSMAQYSSETLTATVTDANGFAVSDQTVLFDSSGSGGTLSATRGVTDSNGEVTITYSVGSEAGSATLTARLESNQAVTAPLDIRVVGAATLLLYTDTPQIGSDGGESATATIMALVKDANNRLMDDVAVSFAADAEGALQILDSVTDAAGIARALLSATGDYRNRTITVTASVANLEQAIRVVVSGTTLVIDGPDALALGNQGSYSAILTDAVGDPIIGEVLTLTSALGNPLSSGSGVTDGSGSLNFTLQADSAGIAGEERVRVSAFGDTLSSEHTIAISSDNFTFDQTTQAITTVPLNTAQRLTLHWDVAGSARSGETIRFTTTRGQFSNRSSSTTATTDADGNAQVTLEANNAGPAVISASVEGDSATLSTQFALRFVATEPATLDLHAEPANLGPEEQSVIRAVVRDGNHNLVSDQRVIFMIDDITSGALSAGEATTNEMGIARISYTAGGSFSAIDGVNITAQIADDETISDSVALTIAERPRRISIGTSELISEPTEEIYADGWVAIVTDSLGNPIADVTVELSLVPIGYRNGQYDPYDVDGDGEPDIWVPNLEVSRSWCQSEDVDGDGIMDLSEDLNANGMLDAGEDLNGNGVLDLGDDSNGNGVLEPSNVAVVSREVTTDSSGVASFDIRYAQSHCSWNRVTLTARIDVDGTEVSNAATWDLECAASDLDDIQVSPPGGVESPYGLLENCGGRYLP